MQNEIIKELNVDTGKPVELIIQERADFLREYHDNTPAKTYVLGISGGVDSFVAAMLVKESGIPLVAITLPCGDQHDMMDSLEACGVINPEHLINHNIRLAVEATVHFMVGSCHPVNPNDMKMITANVMARERMNVQYAYSVVHKGLVVGTDHATEAVIWYFTKYGDGAADVVPLAGLLKDDIYKLAEYFKAPKCIMEKAPSAGLWDGQTDEEELGISYATICKYLRGETVDEKDAQLIESKYKAGYHKGQAPVSIFDTWWKK